MADIFEKLIYQPVRTARVGGVPSIDYAANKEAIRSQATTADALTRIASFAFEYSKGKQEIMGTERGVSAPTQTLQSLAGKDRSSFSFEEEAAYTAASKALSIELGIKAKKAMGEIVLEATNRNADSATLQDALDSVIEGFGGSIDLLDPVAGKEFRLSLEDSRNSLYLNYSEKELQKAKQEQKHKTLIGSDQSLSEIEQIANQQWPDWDSTISRLITNYDGILEAGGLSPSERTAKVLEAKKFAHVSRIKGEYLRQKTLADKRDYLERFEKDIPKSTDTGISRGLLDNEAEAILGSLSQDYNFEVKKLNTEVTSIATDLKNDVSSIISAGGIISEDKISNLQLRIEKLEESGADQDSINKLKIELNGAKDNLDYLRQIKKFNIQELEIESSRLKKIWDAGGADKVIGFQLAQSRAELSSAKQELTAKKAKFQPSLDRIDQSLKQLQDILDNGETLSPDAFDFIETWEIGDLEADPDFIPGMLDKVKSRISAMKQFSNFVEDVKDDSLDDIEKKLIDIDKALESETGEKHGNFKGWKAASILKLRNDVKERQKAIKAGLDSDPLLFANDSGVIELDSNLTDILFAPATSDEQKIAIQVAVRKRMESAQAASNHYEYKTKYFTDTEANAISDILSDPDTPALVQGHFLGNIVQYFGTDAREVLRQVASKKEANQYMHIGGLIANGTPIDVSRKALVGKKISAGMVEKTLGEFEDQTSAKQQLLLNLNSEEAMVSVVDNIKRVGGYIYLASEKKVTGRLDAESYNDALQLAAGRQGSGTNTTGGIVEWNDRQTILPNNIYHYGGLELFFDSIKSAGDLDKYSVSWDEKKQEYTKQFYEPRAKINGELASLKQIKNAQLITVGDGLYKLRTEDGEIIWTDADAPFLLDLKLVGPQNQ